jgi:hypothetical protein
MSGRSGSSSLRQIIAAGLTLGAIHQTAPWPAVQAVFHALLVIGLAPEFRSPLMGALWAAAGGWVVEGTLRMYPHMGGTPFADMVVCLLVSWTLVQWPPRAPKAYWGRLGAFAVLHILLAHGMVLIAAGSHYWGYGSLWTLLTVPLWAALSYKLYLPHYRE